LVAALTEQAFSMAKERPQRRLAAILSVDVVGYSRLMSINEAATLSRLNVLRRELIDPAIAAHSGRIVKLIGDGALVEFASAVEAVTCAIDIQRQLGERHAATSEADPMRFRIGVHVGDIIIEGEDILGDGVNIAARIEGVAKPGGICISDDAYRQVRGKLDANFKDTGEQELKNIARPVRVYQWQPDTAAVADSVSASKPPLPDKPSIAVLPFQNLSGDPEQEYFADGMVEDIVTGLSRIKWLFVIARNSSFVYKGKPVDVRQVGRELGVRYVLEGGVRKSGNRIRVTAQLLEAATGAHVWADRFDGALEDVFDLQDKITEKVVGIVEPSLRQSEIERSRRKHPENLDAYDLYLRAVPHMASVMPADAKIAADFVEAALKLNPNYAAAHAVLAWCMETRFFREGFNETDRVAGVSHARLALAHGGDDPTALSYAALVILHLDKDFVSAAGAIERALALNSSSAIALYTGAHIHGFAGDPALAENYADRAYRVSPFDPQLFHRYEALGSVRLRANRYDEAAAYFAQAVQANPRFSTLYADLTAALELAGRGEEAKSTARRLLELEPGFRVQPFSAALAGMCRPELIAALVSGLCKAGLPE
jgi:adenylate cyclase